MYDVILRLLLAFLVLGLCFGILQKIFPSVRRQKFLRRTYTTDVAYWFLTPPVVIFLSDAVVSGALAGIFLLLGDAISETGVQQFTLMAQQPIWAQIVLGLLLGDLINYWQHRMFHGRLLWPFHAVHHSSIEVDWLSAVRLHPINNLVARSLQALFLALMGFDPDVVAICIPLAFLYALLLHANLSWSFGPLRYIFISPVYHRWHHTRESEGLNKNFGSIFVLWDILFGTMYLPFGRQPSAFGTDSPVPPGFLGQMIYLFDPRNFGR